MTTNKYIHGVQELNWQPFDRRLWERNYYERILRKEDDLHRIRYYIATNPGYWQRDPNFVQVE